MGRKKSYRNNSRPSGVWTFVWMNGKKSLKNTQYEWKFRKVNLKFESLKHNFFSVLFFLSLCLRICIHALHYRLSTVWSGELPFKTLNYTKALHSAGTFTSESTLESILFPGSFWCAVHWFYSARQRFDVLLLYEDRNVLADDCCWGNPSGWI